MSSSPDWRQFEELVARLEQLPAPLAVIQSPDRIRDLVTRRKREVDASIRYETSDGPVLITVECRKRRYRQDDPWIEQLASKRAKLGAAKTIAVSSSGFSPSAVQSAKHFGIELRTFDEITDDDILQQCVLGVKVSLIVTDYTLRGIVLIDEKGTPLEWKDLAPELRGDFEREPLDTAVIFKHGVDVLLTARAVAWRAGDYDVPVDGLSVTKVATLSFDPGVWFTRTQTSNQELSRAEFHFEFKKYNKAAPTKKITDYTDLTKPLASLVESVAEFDDGQGISIVTEMHLPDRGPQRVPDRKGKRG